MSGSRVIMEIDGRLYELQIGKGCHCCDLEGSKYCEDNCMAKGQGAHCVKAMPGDSSDNFWMHSR